MAAAEKRVAASVMERTAADAKEKVAGAAKAVRRAAAALKAAGGATSQVRVAAVAAGEVAGQTRVLAQPGKCERCPAATVTLRRGARLRGRVGGVFGVCREKNPVVRVLGGAWEAPRCVESVRGSRVGEKRGAWEAPRGVEKVLAESWPVKGRGDGRLTPAGIG